MKMIDKNIQKNRLNILQSLLERIQLNKNKNEIGKFKEVLVENKLKNQSKYFGRSEDLTPVIFSKGNESDIGRLVNIKIMDYNRNSLFGVKKIDEREVAA